ncbi:MAG: pyridoxal phosphate-dependent aminotransferase [Rikenellaceae bacterium]|nr:pyridoxal phosphate-dependent aminotransferase [Rikenellaceae bacterium]
MKSSSPFYNFSTFSSVAVDRKGTCCEKYDLTVENSGIADIIPLSIADMDFPCMPEITEAFENRLNSQNYGYSYRDQGFYSSVKNRMQRRYGWNIGESWIEFTPGVGSGVAFALLALTEPESAVLIQPPVYPVFQRLAVDNGRRVEVNPLHWDGARFIIDFDDLEKKLKKADILVLCNPHNPTGRVFSRKELETVGKLCLENGVFIISDEIHSDITQEAYHHIPIASVSPSLADITITLMSPGKSFNLCGLSTSIAIISNDELHKKFNEVARRFHLDQGNIFGTLALKTAYDHGDAWLRECNKYIADNAEYAAKFINQNIPGVCTYVPEGTFLMWVDFRGLGLEHASLKKFLLHKARIELSDGMRYGFQGEGFMRINIGTSREILTEALTRLENAARELTC